MENQTPRQQASVPAPPPLPAAALPINPAVSALTPTGQAPSAATPYIDENGFNPDEYDWVPVRRKPRHDGWSAEKQRMFIGVLADTGLVEEAARAVGMTPQSAGRLRRSPGGEGFDRAWTIAIEHASKSLIDIGFERTKNGTDEPVHDRDGNLLYIKKRFNDRLLMFMLRAFHPERFRNAHRDTMVPGEKVPPPSPVSVAEAIAALDPVPPDEPHFLMPPDRLDIAVQCADMVPGELPYWHRDRDIAAMTQEAEMNDEEWERHVRPFGPEFEEALEAAKRGESHPFFASEYPGREDREDHAHVSGGESDRESGPDVREGGGEEE